MLVEGSSIRATSRVTGTSTQTIMKLLRDVGPPCADYHDKMVRNVNAKRVQCDELWSFCYTKERRLPRAKAPPAEAGNIWTWTAIDADSKLIISWLISPSRETQYAMEFVDDLASRLSNRVQITTDGLASYIDAVDAAFVGDVDYAQLVKEYDGSGRYVSSRKVIITGNPDPRKINTSYVERQNLTIRMSLRRFTRLTNAHSKKIENHFYALAIYFVWYNFCRESMALESMTTPAMAAGLTDRPYSIAELLKNPIG